MGAFLQFIKDLLSPPVDYFAGGREYLPARFERVIPVLTPSGFHASLNLIGHVDSPRLKEAAKRLGPRSMETDPSLLPPQKELILTRWVDQIVWPVLADSPVAWGLSNPVFRPGCFDAQTYLYRRVRENGSARLIWDVNCCKTRDAIGMASLPWSMDEYIVQLMLVRLVDSKEDLDLSYAQIDPQTVHDVIFNRRKIDKYVGNREDVAVIIRKLIDDFKEQKDASRLPFVASQRQETVVGSMPPPQRVRKVVEQIKTRVIVEQSVTRYAETIIPGERPSSYFGEPRD